MPEEMVVDLMEILDEVCVILPTGQKKFVSGLSGDTKCNEVIDALLSDVPTLELSAKPPLSLYECWKTCSRRIAPSEPMQRILGQWGRYIDDVRFELRVPSLQEMRAARWMQRLERRRRRLSLGVQHRRKDQQDVVCHASRNVWRNVHRRRWALVEATVDRYTDRRKKRNLTVVSETQRQAEQTQGILEELIRQHGALLEELKQFENTSSPDRLFLETAEAMDTTETPESVANGTGGAGDELLPEITPDIAELVDTLAQLKEKLVVERQLLVTTTSACETNSTALGLVESEIVTEQAKLSTLEEELKNEQSHLQLARTPELPTTDSSDLSSQQQSKENDIHSSSPSQKALPGVQNAAIRSSAGQVRQKPPPPQRSSSRDKFLELQALNKEVNRQTPSPNMVRHTKPQIPTAAEEPPANASDTDSSLSSLEPGRTISHTDSLLFGLAGKSTSRNARRPSWRSSLDEKLEEAMRTTSLNEQNDATDNDPVFSPAGPRAAADIETKPLATSDDCPKDETGFATANGSLSSDGRDRSNAFSRRAPKSSIVNNLTDSPRPDNDAEDMDLDDDLHGSLV